MKRIAVVGTGYVGTVTGACLADLGHTVVCCDTDAAKTSMLAEGRLPFFEPGLEQLVQRGLREGRLSFTSDPADGITGAEIIYIAVGTPMGPSGKADLSDLERAVSSIGPALRRYAVIAVKSTVPAGTARMVSDRIRGLTQVSFDVVSNPEFLREGSAIADFTGMERAVIGAENEAAAEEIARLYEPYKVPVVRTGWETAELIKYASNAFLAMKISFINNMADLCEKMGADVLQLAEGVGLDSRIGSRYLEAGVGYGGSCFPKDVQALLQMSESAGLDFGILKQVVETNQEQPHRFFRKVRQAMGELRGKTVAVLGLSFKPGTDDMRSAPSVPIIRSLLEAGALVRAYDPVAIAEARNLLGDEPVYTDRLEEAVEGCDAILIVTGWPEIAGADLDRLRARMRYPVVFDGRNLWTMEQMAEAGFEYHSVGRPAIGAAALNAKQDS
jgi:UDPglucose 6-dehydrogenase